MSKLQVVSLSERRDLYKQQSVLMANAWPEFIRHDDVSDKYWMRLIKNFEDYQLLLIEDDKILSIITTVPLHYTGDLSALPEEGWDWVVQKSVEDFENALEPRLLAGIQIVINPDHQGKGVSYRAVSEMAAFAKRKGFSQLIIPVRPTMKFKYPLISIDNYLKWQNDEGFSMDPWIRVHEKVGAKILHTCTKAMKITGTIKEWEQWTDQRFPFSGEYIIDKGLVPLVIDREKNQGCYLEPNVWVAHQIR